MNQVLIGKVLKPKGLDGTIKVSNFELDHLSADFKKVIIDGVHYQVLRSYCATDFVYFKLEGVNSIEQADNLRQKEVYGDKSDINLKNDQFLVQDIIGLDVMVDGKNIGKIESTDNFGAGDIFSIKTKRGSIMVPKIENLVVQVNIAENFIEFDKKTFDEVRV